ncbi:MAG: hypothetical protein PVF68_16700 [Acidobacteriota bacterium]|jgi:hypothetical protein
MSRHRTKGILIGLVLCALAAPAVRAAGAPPTRPRVELRRVFVTDSKCGAAGYEQEDRRRKVLECVSEGAMLQIYDPQRDALYTILYEKRDLQLKVLNDFAGLEGIAQGYWDDEGQTVRLQDIMEYVPDRAIDAVLEGGLARP